MAMIDTEYKSLNDIDPEITRWYSEDNRERVVGYDEETGDSIEEPYTVIVLNKPEEVGYDDVRQRRSERKSDNVVHAEIERAIAWEDFSVNHDGYLLWKEGHSYWTENQPTEVVIDEDGEPLEQVLPEPVRPEIDMSLRRTVYSVNQMENNDPLMRSTGESLTYDDDNHVTHIALQLEPLSEPDLSIQASIIERKWRDSELLRTDIEVFKAIDRGEDTSSLSTYREALRNYPEQEGFPLTSVRPVQ